MNIKATKKTVRGRLHLRISSLTQEKLIPMISETALKAAQAQIKGLEEKSFQAIERICAHTNAQITTNPTQGAGDEKR